MKRVHTFQVNRCKFALRSGFAAKEVVLATAVIITFTMGMYYLGEKSFSRLYHFISTMIGSPYL